MEEAGVPILPGSRGVLGSVEEALSLANEIGLSHYAEGFGRRRRARHAHCSSGDSELPALLAQAQGEAAAAFTNGDVYMENCGGAPSYRISSAGR